MKTSISLIGFMGAGKTTVGRALAKNLRREFVELDALVEQRAGKSIGEIFQQDGEVAFRELEIEATKEVAGCKNVVIACGGGVVLNKINIDRLRSECVIAYLTASPGVLLRRISGTEGERPLLGSPRDDSNMSALLGYRKPFYEAAADIRINTSRRSIRSVVEQIMTELRKDESFDL